MGEKRGDNTSIVCTVTVSSVNTLNSTHIDIATGGGGGLNWNRAHAYALTGTMQYFSVHMHKPLFMHGLLQTSEIKHLSKRRRMQVVTTQ